MSEETREVERAFEEHCADECSRLREHIKAAQEVVNSLQCHYKSLTGQRYHW